jgi:hypothetical protein
MSPGYEARISLVLYVQLLSLMPSARRSPAKEVTEWLEQQSLKRVLEDYGQQQASDVDR